MPTVRQNSVATEDFAKEIIGDDSIMKTNPHSQENPAVNKGKKKIIKNAASKAVAKQQEPYSPTIKNKYKTLASNMGDLGEKDDDDSED